MSDHHVSPSPPTGQESKPRRVARRAARLLFENSLFLIAGAIAALVWANVDSESYEHFIHISLHWGDDAHEGNDAHESSTQPEDTPEPAPEETGSANPTKPAESHHDITLHFIVNDVLMALFFAIAAKEVWESMLPGGSLSNLRKASMPLIATVGGVLGPVAVYIGWLLLAQGWDSGWESPLMRGWAVPTATDIAFCYLIARMIFGAGHPAIAFLLLLAIADDAIGLIIIAAAYPKGPVEPLWLLFSCGGIALGLLFHRVFKLVDWRWYLLGPGALSWMGFYLANLHPALGLVPIIPTMPHAHTDLGIFAREELKRHDTLNAFEHSLKNFVELILGLFGLVNAGVVLSAFGLGTWLVVGGLLVGKPLGIGLFAWISAKALGLRLPDNMNFRELIVVGFVAAIGFTVALFVAEAAFHGAGESTHRDSVKMGALLSFGAAIVAFVLAKILRVQKANQS
ncbi:MAG: Na+/H+ antiporter NhaA [Pirellulales bacterium]|nr:Na+/H+ antiporter NhaA [Pirellulales bacterium]